MQAMTVQAYLCADERASWRHVSGHTYMGHNYAGHTRAGHNYLPMKGHLGDV